MTCGRVPESGWLQTSLLIALGSFVTNVDTTLINALFPLILEEFDRSLPLTSWVINGANLALATGLVLGGRLADARGCRRIYVVGLAAGGISTSLCAMAPGLGWLVAARIGLGLSGALMLASSLALVPISLPAGRHADALGVYVAVGGLGAIAGPLAGAAFVASVGWRWAFATVACFCLAGAVGVALRIPRDLLRPSSRIDWLSAALAGLTLSAVLLSLTYGPDLGWSSLAVLAASGAALLLAGGFALREGRGRDPLFPRALRTRAYGANLVGILGVGFVFGVGLFALPLFVTGVGGGSFAEAGLVLAPAAVVAVVAASASGRLVAALGQRVAAGCGIALAITSLLGYALLGSDSEPVDVLLASGFAGVGIGLGMPALAGGALEAAREAQGSGAGWYHAVRVLGLALGVVAFTGFSTPAPGPSEARAWLSEQPVSASLLDGALLARFDRARVCRSPACLARELAGLAPAASEGTAVVREALRRDLAQRYASAFRYCALLTLPALLLWAALSRPARSESTA